MSLPNGGTVKPWLFRLRYVKWWKREVRKRNQVWDSQKARKYLEWAVNWIEDGVLDGSCIHDLPEDCAKDDANNP